MPASKLGGTSGHSRIAECARCILIRGCFQPSRRAFRVRQLSRQSTRTVVHIYTYTYTDVSEFPWSSPWPRPEIHFWNMFCNYFLRMHFVRMSVGGTDQCQWIILVSNIGASHLFFGEMVGNNPERPRKTNGQNGLHKQVGSVLRNMVWNMFGRIVGTTIGKMVGKMVGTMVGKREIPWTQKLGNVHIHI